MRRRGLLMLVAVMVLTGGWAIIVTLVALTITHVAATSLGISRTRTGRRGRIVTTAKGGWLVGGGVVSSLPTGRAEKFEKCWSGKCVVW